MRKWGEQIDWNKFFVAVCAIFYFFYYIKTATEWHFIDNVNLIIHEAGHSVIFFLGEFVQILAGSLLQILVPLMFVIYFYFRKNYFSSSILLFWVGQNFINVSIYASDAIKMQLPLLGGEASIHDWNYILDSLNILQYTNKIGSALFETGVLIIIASSFLVTINSKKNFI